MTNYITHAARTDPLKMDFCHVCGHPLPPGPPVLFTPCIEVPVWYWYWHWSHDDQRWYWYWTWYYEDRDVCRIECFWAHRAGPRFGS